MDILCTECGLELKLPLGMAATHFSLHHYWVCPQCSAYTQFDPKICLIFATNCWRN